MRGHAPLEGRHAAGTRHERRSGGYWVAVVGTEDTAIPCRESGVARYSAGEISTSSPSKGRQMGLFPEIFDTGSDEGLLGASRCGKIPRSCAVFPGHSAFRTVVVSFR